MPWDMRGGGFGSAAYAESVSTQMRDSVTAIGVRTSQSAVMMSRNSAWRIIDTSGGGPSVP